MFNLMDVNCDGYLQEDEHRRLFHQLGVPDTSFAKETFEAIDANRDGKLSVEEFVDACWEFFFSEDEKNPNTIYFGPLVD
jgi:Ca2+-binding EF-hand superfamily protein